MIHNLPVFLLIGIICSVLSIIIFRRYTIGAWAFAAGTLPNWPLAMAYLGASGLEVTLILSRTLGVLVYPALLVIADVLLIEISLLRFLQPFRGFIKSRPILTALKIHKAIERLQKHYAIPRPERITRVYFSGVISGIVSLLLVILFNV